MDKKRLYRRWKRQYLRGLKSVRQNVDCCRETGSADAVHELRVAIRRTRLLALMGRSVIGRERVRGFRAWSRRLADALSPVRDYDVMIEWAKPACKDTQFVRDLEQDRRKVWREARSSLVSLPDGWADLRDVKPGRRKRQKLAARYKKLELTTREMIEMDATCFERLDAAARHDFRRAVRRLRYLVDLEKKPARVKKLGQLQGSLGELQNAQTMKQLLRKGRNHIDRRRQLIRRARRHESEWFGRCRRSVKSVLQ